MGKRIKDIQIATDPNKPKQIEIALPGGSTGIAFQSGKVSSAGVNAHPAQDIVPDFSEYDKGYVQAWGSRNSYRERQQSAFEMWRNSLIQAGGEAALGTLEGAGYLLDFEQWGNIIQGSEEEYSNWFSDIMKKGKEGLAEEAPVFQTDESIGEFAPGDPTWWAAHAPSVASALSLLIPARGATTLLGAGATKLAKSMSIGRKILQSRSAMQTTQGLTSAVMSRYMENTMEASGIYESTYKQAIAQGLSDEEAKAKAGEAASTTWYANLVNLGTDIMQYTTILKAGSVAKGLGRQALEFGKQMGGEAVEEAVQSVIGAEAQAAALGNFDPFGKDFGTRLTDYIADPDLHTAAVFGALGGGLFNAVGARQEYKKNVEQRRLQEQLSIERAAQVGDVTKVKAIKDLAFADLAAKHIAQGSTDLLRQDLQDLMKQPEIDTDIRQNLDRLSKNLDFIETQYNKLIDNPEVPSAAVMPMIMTSLDIKNKSELLTELQNEQNKLLNDAINRKELDNGFLAMKRDFHFMKAYERLSKEAQIDLSPYIQHHENNFWTAVKQYNTAEQKQGPVLTRIATSADPQIQDTFNKIVATQLELDGLRQDLAAIPTPEGVAQLTAKRQAKKNNAQALTVFQNPNATVAELKAAATLANDPQLKTSLQQLADKKATEAAVKNVESVKTAVKEEKKAETAKKVEKKPEKKADATKQEPPKQQPPKQEPPSNEPPIDQLEPALDEPLDEPVQDNNVDEDKLRAIFGLEPQPVEPPAGTATQKVSDVMATKPITKRVELETPKQPEPGKELPKAKQAEIQAPVKAVKEGAVKTVLKEIAGKWVKEKDPNTGLMIDVFQVETNPDTTPKMEEYGDQKLHAKDVFDSKDNVLTVNTPNISIGTPVVVRVEPEWRFWKTTRPGDVVMNVYRADERGNPIGEALTQIPATTNHKGEPTKTATPASRSFREKVWENYTKGKLTRTRVTYKNYGDLIRLRNSDGSWVTNNISVLEMDMVRQSDGTWAVAKTPHNPIIAFADEKAMLQIPNLETMRGVDEDTASLAREALQVNLSPGSVYTLRRNGTGGFVIAHIEPRQVTKGEIDWLKENLTSYIADKRWRDLKNLITIGQGNFLSNVNEFNPRHLIALGDDIAFQVEHGDTKFWTKINAAGEYADNFASFMRGDEFIFQVYNPDGTERSTQNSANIRPDTLDAIRKSFDDLLNNSYKNINKEVINDERGYIDIITNKRYPSYYAYLVDTGSVTTDLPAGYSIFNATIYLDPNVEAKAVINPVTAEVERTPKSKVVEEIAPKVEKTTEKKPTKGKKNWRDIGKKGREERFRKVTVGTFKVIGDKELSWMQQRFPGDYLSIAESVDRVMAHGYPVFGYFHNAMIRLAQFAEEGSGYHEAFHFVFNTQLDKKQRERILREADKARESSLTKVDFGNFNFNDKRKKIPTSEIFKLPVEKSQVHPKKQTKFYEVYIPVNKLSPSQETISSEYVSSGKDYLPRVSEVGGKFVINDGHHRIAAAIRSGQKQVLVNVRYEEGSTAHQEAIEEYLSEEFRLYMLSGGSYVAKVNSAKPLFKRILDYILQALGFQVSIEKLFEKVANFEMTPEAEANIKRYKEAVNERGVDDARYRLVPGFQRLNEQIEALDAATHLLLQKAIRDSANVPYDEILEKEGNLEKYLQELKGDFEKTFKEIGDQLSAIPEDQELTEAQEELAIRGDLIGTILESWENVTDGPNVILGFKSKAIKNLAKYGFSVKTVTQAGEVVNTEGLQTEEGVDIVENVDEEVDATADDPQAQERVHGVSFLIQSPLKTLSGKVKKFLATIPEYDNSGKQVTTVLGTPKFIDFNKVYANLSSKLAGSPRMYTRLEELASIDPLMRAVKTQLDKHIALGKDKIDQLPAQFFTAFNKSNYRFFTTLIGRDKGDPFARIIETDRRGIERTIIEDWENEARIKGFITSAGKTTGKAKKLASEIEELGAAVRKKEVSDEALRESAKGLLSSVGISLPTKLWEKLTPVDVKSILFGYKSNSLQTFVTQPEDVNPFEGEGLVKYLATIAKDYTEDLQAKTFINEKGNQVSAINLNTYVTDLIAKLTDPDTGKDVIKTFQSDKFYEGNAFLEAALNPDSRKNMVVNVFSAFRESNTAEAKEYTDTTSQDSFISRLTAYYVGKGSKVGYFYLGTLSDKSQQLAIPLPKRAAGQARNFLYDVLRNTVNNEIVRIQRVNANLKAKDDPNFSVKAVKNLSKAASFKYIPGLDNIPDLAASVSKGELSAEQVAAFEPQIEAVINEFIDNEERAYFAKLKEIGIIGRDNNIELPEALSAGNPRLFLQEFFYNDLAWRLEMSKVLHGDIAFYKDAAQYFKRGYQLITPGLQGYYNPELKSAGKKTTYKRAIFSSSIKQNATDYVVSLAKLIDPSVTSLDENNRAVTIAKAYAEGINKTDAQAYCTIEAYRDIMMSLGQWSKDHEQFYQGAWKDGLSVVQAINFSKEAWSKEERADLLAKEAELLLQPLKPFTFGERAIELEDGSTMTLKEQYKESITPLLPVWAKRHTQFAELLAAMQRDKVDIISDSEAVKVGAYAVNTDLSKPLVTRDVPVEMMRFPFIVPAKSKDKILAGTQEEKLIVGNITPETKYTVAGESIDGATLVQRFHETWAKIIEKDYEKLKRKFGVTDRLVIPEENKLEFYQKLQRILLDEIDNRDLPENYVDSLRIILNKINEPEFLVGLDFPALGRKYEQVIANLFKKNILTQKLPGDALINLADFGVTKTKASSELKFIQNKDGQIVEAEVGVPAKFVNGLGLNAKEHYDSATGKIKWESLNDVQKQAMQLIVYRIPTQGKNSMLPVRIAFVLPKSSGSVIMLPGEMTKQGGMDFDVDKSYVMKRTYSKKGIDKSLENELFDIHWAVLTNPAHAEELLNPLDAKVHDEVIEYFEKRGIVSRDVANSPFSVATDLEMEKLAKYSKAMIGTFSKFSVGHATLQSIPQEMIQVSVPVEISGTDYEYNVLGRQRDDLGNMISDNHSAQQNSALDAQKDPKLGYLNITTFNAAVLGYMTDLGVNQKLALTFMNQPVLRALADHYFKNGDNSFPNAIESILEEYPAIKASYKQAGQERIADITVKNLDANLTADINEEVDHQAQVLADFERYFFAAQDMSKLNTALSTDTARDFTSIAAVEAFVNIVEYVTKGFNPNIAATERKDRSESNVLISPDVFDIKKSPVKRVAAFYNYGIKAALDFTSQFYPYSSKAYREVRSEFAKDTLQRNDYLRDKDDINAVNQAMVTYVLAEDGFMRKFLNRISPESQKRWKPFAIDFNMNNYLERMKDKYPGLKENLFIQALRADTTSKRRQTQLIGINNTHGNFNKTNLSLAWADLLNHPNSEVAQFARDLVRFAIETTGFRTTPTGFIDVVPAEFWREEGIASYVSQLHQSYATGSRSINTPDVSKIMARQLLSTDLVKSISVRYNKKEKKHESTQVDSIVAKDGHVVEFSAKESSRLFDKNSERKWARFARIFDYNERIWRLYERQDNSTIYKEIQPLGESNGFVEFAETSDHVSIVPRNQKLRPAYYEGELNDEAVFDNSMEQAYDAVGLKERSQDAEVVLRALIEVETNVKNKEIAQRILNNVSKVRGLKVIVNTQLAEPGVYFPLLNEIHISPLIATPEALRHAVLHELQHAFGLKAYREPISNVEQNFKQSVDRAYKEAKERIKTNEYGLESAEEFIAELASNTEFRQKLRKSQSLWQKIVRMFRRLLGLNDSYDAIIQQFYDVMDNADTLTFFSHDSFYLKTPKGTAIADPILNKLMQKVISNLEKTMARLKRTGKEYIGVEGEIKALSQLEDKKALVEYIYSTTNKIKHLSGQFVKLEKQPDKVKAERIRTIKEQLNSYKTLYQIRDYIAAHPDQYADLNRDKRTLVSGIDAILGDLRTLENQLNELSLDVVATWVQKHTSEKMTFDEVKEQLRVADRDITTVNRGLDAIIDSRDPVLRVLGKEVAAARARAYRKTEKLLKTRWIEVNQNYENWLRSQGINPNNLRERNKFILDPQSFQKDSKGIYLLPESSREGRRIRSLDDGHPLKEYYLMIIGNYLESQKRLPRFMRPGYRIPSIRRTTWESFTEEKGFNKLRILKEGFIDSFRKTFDERDYQATDEAGNPIDHLPVRFISKQDGKDGRMSTREVSLDIASTTLLFIDEMNNHNEMLDIVDDLELAKDVLANREIAKTHRQTGFAGMLSSDRVAMYDDNNNLVTVKGEDSNSYKMAKEFMRRFVYGHIKENEGNFTLLGVKFDTAKTIDTVLKWTGIRMMLGNINVAFSNVATGEATMLKEAVGGRYFTMEDWWYAKKRFAKDILAYATEFGKRKTESKFGAVFEFFNPEDQRHDFATLSKDTSRLRKGASMSTLSLPNKIGTTELSGTAMLAIMNKYKFTAPDGSTVNLYDALEVHNGVPRYKEGYKPVTPITVDEVRQRIIAITQKMHGIYNLIDSPGIRAHSMGRAVMLLRNWLKPGIDARWKLKHHNERLNMTDEGYYVSALKYFTDVYGKDGWMQGSINALRYMFNVPNDQALLTTAEKESLSEEEQADLINLRKANRRKFLFEIYLIAVLSAVAALGWDDDEKDSFILYQIVRLKRELSTFISPMEAWSVVRNPTVMLDTIQRLTQFTYSATIGLTTGEAWEEYEQGPNKGEIKWKARLLNQLPLVGMRNQFEEFDRRIDLIERGWK